MGCVAAAIRLALATAAAVAATVAAAQPASVAGTVVDSSSGKPLERVHITLLRDIDSSAVFAPYGAMSDSAGHFSIAGIEPGHYNVRAERTGYLADAANAGINLKPGQRTADLSVKMALASMLTGRVLDSYGDPMMHIDVDLMGVSPKRATDAVTDDRGEFHFLAAPGKYRLEAHPERFIPRGSVDGFYGPTFYPSALTEAAAAVVNVTAGRDLGGLDIGLMAPGPKPLTISGTVTGFPAESGAVVLLWRTDGQPSLARADAGGKFTIGGLLPGEYVLIAQANVGLSARMPIKLDASDLTNLMVVLNRAVEVAGTVEPVGKWTVRLQRSEPGPFFPSAPGPSDVGADGAFRIAGVAPGSYRVIMGELPENAYIRKVEADGETVAEVLEVAPGSAPHVKVTLGLDGAVLSGRILDADGEPEDRGQLSLRTGAKDIYRTTNLRDGKYTFTGVRPGKYRLVAHTDTDGEKDMQALYDAAEEIELKPGDRIVKDVKVSDAKKP